MSEHRMLESSAQADQPTPPRIGECGAGNNVRTRHPTWIATYVNWKQKPNGKPIRQGIKRNLEDLITDATLSIERNHLSGALYV